MATETLAEVFRSALIQRPESCTYRFLPEGEGEADELVNAELDRRAAALAATLQRRLSAGDRALIVSPPGLDYLVAFLACLYARVVAVPVYPPNPVLLKRTLPRLLGVIGDARPDVVLAPSSLLAMAEQLGEQVPSLRSLSWQAIDAVDTAAEDWVVPGHRAEDIAFLQYTSGSTGTPKGVVLTGANLLANLQVTNERFVDDPDDTRLVSWLPPYHDMGLIGGMLQPLYGRFPVTFMSPVAFVKKPLRWLRAISDTRATLSGSPNFGYELCVAKTTEAERAALDLSRWRLAFSGAEPVRAETIERFVTAFAPAGMRRTSFFPCYGLAEATLFVAGGPQGNEPTVLRLAADALEQHEVREAAAGEASRTVVGCGRPVERHDVAIVDPDSRARLSDGQVGEVWVSGPSVAHGYWERPAQTAEVFGARLADSGEAGYLRTGDLGFLRDGQLYVTGRRKDLLILAGRNHYPHDIEHTVAGSDPALAPGGGVACAVEVDGEERLLVVHEALGGDRLDTDRVFAAVRAAVAADHGVAVHAIALLRRGKIPKTSSGKLQRAACRRAYVEGTLDAFATWSATDPPAPPSEPVPASDTGPRKAGAAGDAAETSVQATRGPDRTALVRRLTDAVAQRLGRGRESIDSAEPLAALGLSSVDLVGLTGELERWIGRPLSSTLTWEFPTIDALADHLAPDSPGAAGPASARAVSLPVTVPPGSEPVAIVGIGCRFPGGADGPAAFWDLLRAGTDAITEVPADRWDPAVTAARWGGFLDRIDEFDPAFFGISAHEAARMDPQQRLLAEVAWEALEDAGLPPDRLAGSATGVFVGVATNDYGQRTFPYLDRVDAYSGTGNALSIAANRLSYLLDLRGPSLAVDTACSSSLVAVYEACASLARGDCSLALAGGVNVILSPALAINFTAAGAMAADGRCKAFDARADGYVRSEGAGVVVLKPLSRAVADGDPIYSVIVGGAVNQDGRTNGLMAPNPQAQEEVLRIAHARAGLRPAEVGYVETHGTGTLLGDPIEAKALATVFASGREPEKPLLIGSVKSNLGHLEAAAGVAGLIKTALALHHRTLPPSIHFHRPNPHIPFDELALRVVDTLRPWPEDDHRPAAGVSGFGFGGTNAHLVLRAPETTRVPAPVRPGPHLLPLSARTPAAATELTERYRTLLTADADLGAVSAAAAVHRSHHEHRVAVVADSAAAAREALAAARPVSRRIGRRPRVVFVFSGQGPRWWPLDADLITGEPAFREAIDGAEAALRPYVDWSLTEQLTSPTSRLADPDVAQPALCAVQIALAAVWREWGVEPAAVVGHSVGEIAAAQVAGALPVADALRIAAHRGRVIRGAAGNGAMAAVGVSRRDTERFLAGNGDGAVTVAAANGPRSTIVSGAGDAVRALAAAAEAQGVPYRLLESVPFASHSPQMEPLAAELAVALAGLRPHPTTLEMYSTVTGAAVPGRRLGAEYWATNLRRTVLFDPAVTALAENGFDTYVEIAPHPSLGDDIGERLEALEQQGAVVGSLHRGEPGRTALRRELARLYHAGFPLDWTRIVGPTPMVTLPTYPWQRARHWIDQPVTGSVPGAHPALGAPLRSAAQPHSHHWAARLDSTTLPYLDEHRVAGTPVLPAALLLDAALCAARQALGAPVDLVDVELTSATVVEERVEAPNLQVVLEPETLTTGSVRLFTRRPEAADDAWTQVATAACGRARNPADSGLADARRACAATVDVAEHYGRLAAAGLEYGSSFRKLTRLVRGDGQVVAELSTDAPVGAHLLHPTVLDAGLQALAAATQGRLSGTYLPVAVGRFSAAERPGVPRWAHAVLGRAADPDGDEVSGCEVRFYDSDGSPVAELTGVVLRRLPGDRTDPLDAALRAVRWQESPAPDGELVPGRRWLLLADRGGVTSLLRDAATAHGTECVSVTAGADYRRAGPSGFTVDPEDPAHVDRLLADLAADGTPVDTIVHAWALGPETDAPWAVGDAGVLSLLQGLIRAGSTPRLVLLTRGTQAVTEAGSTGLAGSSLWGLARVLRLEHPELSSRIVDLDPSGDDRLLYPEITRGAAPEVALRAGARWTARLDRWYPPDATPERRPTRFDARQHGNYRVLATRPGVLESLTPVRCDRVRPGPGEVQIEVAAAGLNFSDVLKALGSCPGVPPGIVPLGAECAGRVVAVGEGVDTVDVGDRVMAIAPGSFSAWATTSARLVVRTPDGLTDEQAAAIPVAYLTAVYGLEHLARLAAGETVLVHSATGGVGLAALAVARRAGATVIATAGTEAKRALLRDLGVDHVFDSRSLAFADEVSALTGGRGVDVVLNSLAGEALVRSVGLLAPHGRFVEIGKQDVYANSRLGLEALSRNRTFFAVDLEQSFAEQQPLIAKLFDGVRRGLVDGALAPLPVTVFPYADAAAACASMAQARHTGKLVLRPDGRETVVPHPDAPPVRADVTYLITGGLGALGLQTAGYLAEQGARHLVLVGRSAPSDAAVSSIHRLRASGVSVLVRPADVGRADEVETLIAGLADGPPLAGIVHAAGVLDDGLLAHLDRDRLRAVAAPKAAGAWHLHRATIDADLDFFVLYSSAAALVGSPGQGGYAAANAFLDGLARLRRSQGLPALSIAWGPWSESGLAATGDRAGALAARGVTGIGTDLGLAALDRLLRSAATEACVLPLDLEQLRSAAASGLLPPLLAQIAGTDRAATREGTGEVARRLLTLAPGRGRRAALTRHCALEVSRVLHIDADQVDPTEPLASMGFDSLLSLELRRRLETGLAIELPATVVWRFPTLETLVPYLAERMQIPLEGRAGVPDTPAVPTEADLEELDRLSAGDVEALLRDKLTQIEEGHRG